MTEEQQRIEIAEACGWTECHVTGGLPYGIPPWHSGVSFRRDYYHQRIPDYLRDLNAMHEAEKALTEEQCTEYGLWINRIMLPREAEDIADMMHVRSISDWHATAAQRAEAFRRTIGKLEEAT